MIGRNYSFEFTDEEYFSALSNTTGDKLHSTELEGQLHLDLDDEDTFVGHA